VSNLILKERQKRSQLPASNGCPPNPRLRLGQAAKPLDPMPQVLFGQLRVGEFLFLMGNVDVPEIVDVRNRGQQIAAALDLETSSNGVENASDLCVVIEGVIHATAKQA